MDKMLKRWDLHDKIIERVCEIEGLILKANHIIGKDGFPMLYHDWECVAFADMPIKVSETENVIAVYLYGDGCLELNIYDGNPENYGESFYWGNFNIEVLEKVLETLNKINE